MDSSTETAPVAVVIGGGSGLGQATAAALAAAGHTIALADIDADAATGTVDGLAGEHTAFAVDVADEQQVAALFAGVTERYGSYSGVVNCAGVSTLSPVVDHDADEFRRVLDVCLTGSFLVLKHGAAGIDDGGSLVTLASLNGSQPGSGMAAYCSAKAGLVMLSKVAALELGPRRIRVNTVSPGLVVTPLTAPAMDIPGVRESYLANTPLGRSGEADEVAAAVRFLLSPESAWITGEDLQINGGAHLQRYPDLLGLVAKAFG